MITINFPEGFMFDLWFMPYELGANKNNRKLEELEAQLSRIVEQMEKPTIKLLDAYLKYHLLMAS